MCTYAWYSLVIGVQVDLGYSTSCGCVHGGKGWPQEAGLVYIQGCWLKFRKQHVLSGASQVSSGRKDSDSWSDNL